MSPNISVILVFHDRLEYLESAIESVWSQSLDRDSYELVVVGPERPSALEKCSKGADFRFIESKERTLGGKLIEGLESTSGEILTFLEDDDQYSPDRLSHVSIAFRDPAVTYLQNGFSLIDREGKPYVGPFHNLRKRRTWDTLGLLSINGRPESSELWPLSRIPAGFNNSSIAVRRRILSSAARDLLRGADLISDVSLLYVALAQPGRLLFDPNPLTRIRVHADSVSNPSTGTSDQHLAQLHSFSIRTDPARAALLSYVRTTGPASLIKEVEGMISISNTLRELRSPHPVASELAFNLLRSLSRVGTHEVRARLGALPLALVAMTSPSLARSAYSRLRRLEVGQAVDSISNAG